MVYPLDIHTHCLPSLPGQAITNVAPDIFRPQPDCWYSVGLHPWHLEQYEWTDSVFRSAFENRLRHPQVLAVGEAGLDKLTSTPFALQREAFRYQVLLAEAVRKPLIIHLVKAADELLALRKKIRPTVPWIIHGFRGNPIQADMYLRHGFYLSFGEKYNEEAMKQVPADRLFMETDESKESIALIYERAANLRGTSPELLEKTVLRNVLKVFFSR